MSLNSQVFTPEDCKKGLDIELLKTLLHISDALDEAFLDIHIKSDGYCRIIEWDKVYFDSGFENSKFEYLQADELVMKELYLPDGTYTYVDRGEEEEYLANWLQEHPEYIKTEYGQWVNKNDLEEFDRSPINEEKIED